MTPDGQLAALSGALFALGLALIAYALRHPAPAPERTRP